MWTQHTNVPSCRSPFTQCEPKACSGKGITIYSYLKRKRHMNLLHLSYRCLHSEQSLPASETCKGEPKQHFTALKASTWYNTVFQEVRVAVAYSCNHLATIHHFKNSKTQKNWAHSRKPGTIPLKYSNFYLWPNDRLCVIQNMFHFVFIF